MLPGSGPAGPRSDNTQSSVPVLLASLLILPEVLFDHCHVATVDKALAIHMFAGLSPVLVHGALGDGIGELTGISNSSELPPQRLPIDNVMT